MKRNLTKNIKEHLLVIRTSAMGDVALMVPVLKGMREQYPGTALTLLTRDAYKNFFISIKGLDLVTADFNGRNKGLSGIFRLSREISEKSKISRVIDLHDVIRSKVLRNLFRMSGAAITVIDKGKKEKSALISGKKNKIQLKHTVERYCEAFEKAGFPVRPSGDFRILSSAEAARKAGELIGSGYINIGVAPYAKHKLKMWPEEKMVKLLGLISEKHNARFFLFGGKEDHENMSEFRKKVPGSVNLIGKLDLDEELAVMNKLDLMIAMDSSNMHMASLAGIRVISIWGGTDPLTGFGAWMQPEEFSVRIPVDELTCRPCTIYGRGECKRGDFACMAWLTPEMVYRKIQKILA